MSGWLARVNAILSARFPDFCEVNSVVRRVATQAREASSRKAKVALPLARGPKHAFFAGGRRPLCAGGRRRFGAVVTVARRISKSFQARPFGS